MKKFIIEREVPGAGEMTDEELVAISKVSVAVISVSGKPYTWIESFITNDKIYCVHEAENEEDIREHSKCADLPIHLVEEVKAVIGPETSKGLK